MARVKPGTSGRYLHDYKTYSSHAEYFADLVKHLHRLPSLDDLVWKRLDVEYITMDRPFGGWRIEQVWFDDGSCYEAAGPDAGKVDETFMLLIDPYQKGDSEGVGAQIEEDGTLHHRV